MNSGPQQTLWTQFLAIAISFSPVLLSTSVKAQYDLPQCTWMLQQISQSIQEDSLKKVISLERQNLAFCKEHMSEDHYLHHLNTLASSLDGDGQPQEALGVANQCLQINPAYLACLSQKASALYSLGSFQDAKIVIEGSLAFGAITEFDVLAQKKLRKLSESINAALNKNRTVTSGDRVAPRSAARQIPPGVSGKISCDGKSVNIGININGEINSAAVESVRKLFDQYHEQQRKLDSGFVCEKSERDSNAVGFRSGINSGGGSIDAAMTIGRMFRNERVSLDVRGVCFSTCVLILAGAVERRVGDSDQVGIHRPFFGTTPETPLKTDQIKEAYLRMLQEIRSYLRETNVPQRLADDMLAIEPENNRILTRPELKSYGLTGVDPVEQQARAIAREAMNIQEANRMGLDRLEYTRRKALVSKACPLGSNGSCYEEVMKTGKNPALPDFSQFGTPVK
jgi:ATP-dependent protease ClpP protease subunit/predicted ester cyclase